MMVKRIAVRIRKIFAIFLLLFLPRLVNAQVEIKTPGFESLDAYRKQAHLQSVVSDADATRYQYMNAEIKLRRVLDPGSPIPESLKNAAEKYLSALKKEAVLKFDSDLKKILAADAAFQGDDINADLNREIAGSLSQKARILGTTEVMASSKILFDTASSQLKLSPTESRWIDGAKKNSLVFGKPVATAIIEKIIRGDVKHQLAIQKAIRDDLEKELKAVSTPIQVDFLFGVDPLVEKPFEDQKESKTIESRGKSSKELAKEVMDAASSHRDLRTLKLEFTQEGSNAEKSLFYENSSGMKYSSGIGSDLMTLRRQ